MKNIQQAERFFKILKASLDSEHNVRWVVSIYELFQNEIFSPFQEGLFYETLEFA